MHRLLAFNAKSKEDKKCRYSTLLMSSQVIHIVIKLIVNGVSAYGNG